MLFVDTTAPNDGMEDVHEFVANGHECDSLHSLAQRFVVIVARIAANLSTIKDNAENILDALKLAALSKIALGGVPNLPSEEAINDAHSFKQLFYLLHIHRNWVDISFLEQLVEASESNAAVAILADYQKSHHRVISKALARQIDPSTDGACPRPDANSCILQMVFKREDMLLQQVLACRDFLCDRFRLQAVNIKYLSAVIGNSLVVTWLVSRRTGLRIVNQCRSPPALAALQEIEVIVVRLRYPGQLISVKVDVSAGI